MTPESVVGIGQHALFITVLLAAPPLLAALAVGVLIGMIQAATQINEMTLSFIPKLLAMVLALILAGPWMLQLLIDYTQRLMDDIPLLLG
jgi:flagellar biosynthetic protein FliQ